RRLSIQVPSISTAISLIFISASSLLCFCSSGGLLPTHQTAHEKGAAKRYGPTAYAHNDSDHHAVPCANRLLQHQNSFYSIV
ncbi:hypothetical protein, partial [Salmonella enterica]|uniref:hypothetical protein n=1 Tax=Salmonella enterica TaxID=28901 RepID=UPI003CF8FFB4